MSPASPFDLHVHLFCEEMETRDTPAVLAPGMTDPMEGSAVPVATALPATTTTPGTATPTDGTTNGSGVPTTAGTSSGTATAPNASSPFGSFALAQPNTFTLNSPNNTGTAGISLLAGGASGSLLVNAYAGQSVGVSVSSGLASKSGDAAGTSTSGSSSAGTVASNTGSNSGARTTSESSTAGTSSNGNSSSQ